MAYAEDLYQLRNETTLAPQRDVPTRRPRRAAAVLGAALVACAIAGAAVTTRTSQKAERLAETTSPVVVHAYVDAL